MKEFKILISSTQYPYYGGSATNAYALIKQFRKKGYRTAGLFIENKNVIFDPDKVGGIFKYNSADDISKLKVSIKNFLGGYPTDIFAKNYVAPVFSKNIFPKANVIYLVAGCPQMIELSSKKISAIKYLLDSNVINFPQESKCVEVSDLIIPNSELGMKLLKKHYGNILKISSPINTSSAVNNKINSMPFKKKSNDLIFVASNFSRKVKNADFAKKIFSNMEDKKKIVVGKESDIFKNIKNTTIYSHTNNSKVLELLSNSKLLICPSYYDASPNIVTEALGCGANILVSQNCGWSEKYPNEMVCQDVYNLNEWTSKAKELLIKSLNIKLENENNIIEELIKVIS